MCACTLPEKYLLSTDSSLEKEHLKKKSTLYLHALKKENSAPHHLFASQRSADHSTTQRSRFRDSEGTIQTAYSAVICRAALWRMKATSRPVEMWHGMPSVPDFWRCSLTECPGRLPALAFIQTKLVGLVQPEQWLWNLEKPFVPWRYSMCQAIIIKCWGRHLGNIYGTWWLSW